MKILAIGDFHGVFPKKLKEAIKKEKIDIVVSTGDYLPFYYRKLWFKHCYGKEIGLWEVIGKARYKKLVKKELEEGEKILKKLNFLGLPVITVLGNMDYPFADDIIDEKRRKREWKFDLDRKKYFIKLIKKYKNLHLLNYSSCFIGGYFFIGMRGHTMPGKPESKAFKKHKEKLNFLFAKLKKQNKNKIIFVSHNSPHNTKLDKISKKAHKIVKGKHYGSKLALLMIKKWQPILAISGHIHEGRGIQKIKKTLCINPGEAKKGKFAIIEIPESKKEKIKVKLKG